MSVEILVSGQTSGWLIAGRIVSPLAVVGGLGLAFAGELLAGCALVVLGVLLGAIGEAYALRQRLRRCWVTDLGNGFRVRDGHGERLIGDHEVLAMGYEITPIFSNGERTALRRQCTIWPMTGAPPAKMDYKWPESSFDMVGDLLSRIFDDLSERLSQMRDEGETVVGDVWRLDLRELVGNAGSQEVHVPIVEITACQEFDGKMQIWRRGQDEACLVLPRGGANTCFLPGLLAEQLERVEAEPADTGTLGRILFERRAKTLYRVLWGAGGFVAGVVGFALLVAGKDGAERAWGVVAMLAAVLMLAVGWALKHSLFRCHERGVYQQNMFFRRQLRYIEVESFSYSSVRHYHNGAYVGTHLTMKFVPLAGVTVPAINYRATIHGEDASLEELRVFISRVICGRMARELSEGRPVVWTPRLKLHPEGFECVPSGFFGKKAAEFLPYSEYGGYTFDQGVFSLLRQGQPKPVVTEQSSAANFFPGFEWLLFTFHSEQEAEEAEGETQPDA